MEKRVRAVANITKKLELLTPQTRLVEVASSIAGALLDIPFTEDIENIAVEALSEESPSFIRQGEQSQILVCIMLAALEFVQSQPYNKNGCSSPDILAAALWSAFSFQDPQTNALMESLRSEVLAASIKRVKSVAELSRERSEVPEIGNLTIPDTEETVSKRTNSAFRIATQPLIAALRENAELDREEIEFLWWSMAEYSDLLNLPWSDLEGVSRAIVAGMDCAKKLRKLPTDGHKHIVLRSIQGSEEKYLSDIVTQLSAYREKLISPTEASLLSMSSIAFVFPLLTALSIGPNAILRTDIRLCQKEWGSRALLEGSILKIIEDRPSQ